MDIETLSKTDPELQEIVRISQLPRAPDEEYPMLDAFLQTAFIVRLEKLGYDISK